MKTISVEVEVLGKDCSRGFFGKKYTVVVQSDQMNNGNAVEQTVPFAQYCQLQIGETYTITMYQHYDGLWYFQP